MKKLEVDEEVFALLQEMSEPLVDTANDVLRRLLNLPCATVETKEMEDEQQDAVPNRKRRGGKRWTLNDLVVAGHLKEGQRLVWYRRNFDRAHYATVTDTGALKLETGLVVTSLAAACSALADGTVQNGWEAWKTEGGVRLVDYRDRMDAQ